MPNFIGLFFGTKKKQNQPRLICGADIKPGDVAGVVFATKATFKEVLQHFSKFMLSGEDQANWTSFFRGHEQYSDMHRQIERLSLVCCELLTNSLAYR